MPSSMPSPARRMGTMPSFLPSSIFARQRATGVSISTSRSGKSRVISYAMSMAISESSSRNSFVPVSFIRMMVSLCWMSG